MSQWQKLFSADDNNFGILIENLQRNTFNAGLPFAGLRRCVENQDLLFKEKKRTEHVDAPNTRGAAPSGSPQRTVNE